MESHDPEKYHGRVWEKQDPEKFKEEFGGNEDQDHYESVAPP